MAVKVFEDLFSAIENDQPQDTFTQTDVLWLNRWLKRSQLKEEKP